MKLAFLSMLLVLCSCASSIHQKHVSGFAPYAGEGKYSVVEAEAKQFTVMGIIFNNDYVDRAYDNLLGSCKGHIVGITTQYSTDLSFFSWTNRVKFKGMCLGKT